MLEIEKLYQKTRVRLDEISPSMCLAKWLQVTLHLHTGHNHSCHHPLTHQTPLSELKTDPSALHNTTFKKKLQVDMKAGRRPKECGYCWNIEDLGPQYISDRVIKSAMSWARHDLQRVVDLPAHGNINPTYVEVSFSNVCNFKCSYCTANFSTGWKEDLRKHGPYATGAGAQTMDILPEEDNPYIDAFWKWWPDLVQTLRVFRITGGEPLLSKNTFQIMEDIAAHPRPEMELAINSNLGVSDASFQRFLRLATDLTRHRKIKRLSLYTSVDAWGPRAEYIRNGLDFRRFQKNVEAFLQSTANTGVIFMVTFNALSPTSFLDLLRYVKDINARYPRTNDPLIHDGPAIDVDVSYLREPRYQSVQILPPSYRRHLEEMISYMKAWPFCPEIPEGFGIHEIQKLERTLAWMEHELPESELRDRRRNFYLFFSEHDRRRGTDFLKAFPEMEEFWHLCRNS
ncbi:MAG TPA: twitch domain-containing radical SAM protein [Pseudobdellovibrionaceae bacterium]|nr:twitch domain-containing radical SAM protein [Pseudobdellovibrionaceae bacterium]